LGSEDDVPLIRIPHLVEADDPTTAIVTSWRATYNTVFFFGALDVRLLHEEVGAFDSGCLLFLNHLERVALCAEGDDRVFARSSHIANSRHFVMLADTRASTVWEVLSGNGDRTPRVALKMDEERIVPAPREQATIHSFIPTTEYAGAPIKFNGDFTTDPSRKTVDLDSTSTDEFLKGCKVLCEAVREAIERQIDRPGIFGALTTQTLAEGRLRPMFWRTISSILSQTEMALPGGFRGAVTSIRLRPEWLNHTDYEVLCGRRWPHIDRDLLVAYPELGVFLSAVGAVGLTLEEALGCAVDANLSIGGRAELFARCVVQYRYDCEGDRLRWLRQLSLFPTRNGLLAAEGLSDASDVNPEFLRYVSEAIEASDLAFVLKRLGIYAPITPVPAIVSPAPVAEGSGAVQSASAPIMVNAPVIGEAKRPFQNPPAIAKWRSAERNALEYIKAMDTVLGISDVSQANLGHDLEVMMKSGKRKLVEVKSVSSFTEPFRLTSNEYATASSAGADYVLAIVVNSDQFNIRFVCNPVAVLNFERRCERWSWQCSDYASSGSDPEQVFSAGRATK
jgi:hypothetical protein